MTAASVVLLSLEPWDDVWRRNQHLAVELVDQGLARRIVFVEPATPGRGRRFSPRPGIDVVRPGLVVPRRTGGLHTVAAVLRTRVLPGHDRLWVNDAPIGALCLADRPTVYDVTDDWRTARSSRADHDRMVRAEDRLTRAATVVVCSDVLARRWQERYDVSPTVVRNAADVDAYRDAVPVALTGRGPHVGYVGTLHRERLDLDLVVATARDPRVGTVHLVGPDHLRDGDRSRLAEAGVLLHGPVPAAEVPAWTVAFDVLLCPHVVSEFTLSLDGIKVYEYMAAGRPVVATPTGGFQELLGRPGVVVVGPGGFVEAVATATTTPCPRGTGPSWAQRAREFADVLEVAA